MRIFGYFDASGAHGNKDGRGNHSPAVVVAGFLSTPFKWQEFDKKWKRLLADAEVPYFHAAELIGKKGVYSGWSKEQTHDFIAKALAIIKGSVLYGIGMALLRDDYYKVIALHPVIENIFGNPYNFCTIRCWETGIDWARLYKHEETIKYIFESGDHRQHEILKAHAHACKDEEVRKFWRFGAGELVFEDGAQTTPLQAADFLAYSMYREQYRLSYTPGEPQRQTVQTFLQIPGMYKYYVEEHLHEYIKEVIDEYDGNEKSD